MIGSKTSAIRWSLFLLMFVLPALDAFGEQLPLKSYTTANGLASDRIHCILPDSHGFLWLGTEDGISLFDGYVFTNHSVAEGLPAASVQALIEAHDGVYWIGTNGGLVLWEAARQVTRSRAPFFRIPLRNDGRADDVQALLEDRAGSIWAGTASGLFRLEADGKRWKATRVPLGNGTPAGAEAINALVEDRAGVLWIGAEEGLFRRSPGGVVDRMIGPGPPLVEVRCLVQDRRGSLWAGTRPSGLFEVRGSGVRQAFTRANGLAGDHVAALLETSDGKLWAACYGGVTEIAADRSGLRSYSIAEGLSGLGMWSLAEDNNGNLWIGSESAGVMRIARNGFRRYDARDGLASDRVASLFEGPSGEPCAFTRGKRPEEIAGEDGFLECYDGKRFHTGRPHLPKGTLYGWGWQQVTLVDRTGEWWVPTLSGLFRFPAVPLTRLGSTPPRRVYTKADGLPSNQIFRLYEDSRGDLWISLLETTGWLVRWDRRTDSFRIFTAADGVPREPPMSFAEDGNGAVWIGFQRGGLARHRDGQTILFTERDGLPRGSVRALHLDTAGRMWIATSRGGVARIDVPADAKPRFVTFGLAHGLSSEVASSLAEDRWGRIYAGTERGLDRIDPTTGNVQHFTADDGLTHGVVEASFRDRNGNLWFGAGEGLSWLEPAREQPKSPPAVRITRVKLDGVRQPLAELGEVLVELPDAGREAAPLEFDFGGIDYAPGGRLRYQYRLEGVDRDWSAPSDQRSVVLARLPGGTYRFRVRAIANDGTVGTNAAEVRFTVLPPLWRRPGVLLLLALGVGALAYGLHRNRLRSALAVERVRMRVATDLHDDIGADLSEIAILSELAGKRDESQREPLIREIGSSARRLVDTLSDVVWSTDPSKDDLGSVVQRIRHFASNTLESRGIEWKLEVPEKLGALTLDPERRRQIFLILKEAVTNVARHSGCTRASLRILLAADALSITIEDDGRGFDISSEAPASGHGLASMRARAVSLGAEFRVESHPSGGTRIVLLVPLAAARPASGRAAS
ncbi:MAG: ATP-binding protein [Thermoanaerobaculia bacterium]|nr:ATP-binding protein [Thermoanaerobaculia bacterium]